MRHLTGQGMRCWTLLGTSATHCRSDVVLSSCSGLGRGPVFEHQLQIRELLPLSVQRILDWARCLLRPVHSLANQTVETRGCQRAQVQGTDSFRSL